MGEGHRAPTATRSRRSPKDLPDETVAALQQTAVAVFQALELRDYARIDMRLRPDGRVAVIEANPNPWLASKAEFAMAARKTGRTYTQLVGEIVELALARYGGLTRQSSQPVPWRAFSRPLSRAGSRPMRPPGLHAPIDREKRAKKPDFRAVFVACRPDLGYT